MIRAEVEWIGLDFVFSKLKLFIDVKLYRVDPVSVIPNMEVLFVFCEK
jgi:hypothetical protein